MPLLSAAASSIREALNHQNQNGTPTPVIISSFFIPYLICCLVNIPSTRLIRLGLLPLGLVSTIYLVLTFKASNGLISLLVIHFALLFNFNSAVRWCLATGSPAYRSAIPPPRSYALRDRTPFLGLHLLLDSHRHTSLVPYTQIQTSKRSQSPQQPSNVPAQTSLIRQNLKRPFKPYNLSLPQHALHLFLSLLAIDIFSSPTNLLVSPNDPIFGLRAPLGRILWGTSYFAKGCAGEFAFGHLVTIIGTCTGLWSEQEWGIILDKPWLASSVIEFWGKRWHDLLTEILTRYIPFFDRLPKSLQILWVFTNSALYHCILYYPMHHHFPFYQNVCFFAGSGVICLIERGYGKISGKRMGGTLGRIWTWIMLLIVSGPLVEYCHGCGWGKEGRDLARRNADSSLFYIIYKAFGGTMVKD